jgi:hypothetical protein
MMNKDQTASFIKKDIQFSLNMPEAGMMDTGDVF